MQDICEGKQFKQQPHSTKHTVCHHDSIAKSDAELRHELR